MTTYETLWTFDTAHLRIEWAIAPDEDLDISYDETNETRDKLASGEWTGFVSRVRVIHKESGAELGTDYLGGSVYENPRQFRTEHLGARGKWGAYFPDMVRNACTEARASLRRMQSVRVRG
jgi:hypothetical protein